MEFWIPEGASRFHFGGGARFIPGGAMPQEIVVPVITVRHVRGLSAQETKTRPVAVQVLGGSHRITTGRHRFQLIQMEPVCERVKAVSLKGAVYEADGPVTNIETVTFDSSRISASIRPHRCGVQGARGAVMTADGRQVSGTETPGRVFCGPAELLARLLDGRGAARRTTPERYGNLSDAAVSRLVLLCYYASQAGEEGRYPTFRVHASPENNPPDGVSDPWQLLRLTQPIVLEDVDDLRRLAPSASSHDFALEIRERVTEGGDPTLTCTGIRMAHSGDGATKVLDSSIWARSVRPGLMIRVDGPGELRVREGGRAFDLRAGHLLDLGGLPTHLYQGWQAGLISRLTPEVGEQEVMMQALHFVWHEILHSTSAKRHGGCYVVLPNAPVASATLLDRYGIRIKYHVGDLCLGETIASFVSTCLKGKKQPDSFRDLANEWMWKRHNLLSQAECVVSLSGVDGCTLFDGDLRLLGFGGKIEAKDGKQGRPFKDFASGQALERTVLARTGTRHLWAFRLCDAADAISCYVISQDGPVTLFWSDDEAVWRWSTTRSPVMSAFRLRDAVDEITGYVIPRDGHESGAGREGRSRGVTGEER